MLMTELAEEMIGLINAEVGKVDRPSAAARPADAALVYC